MPIFESIHIVRHGPHGTAASIASRALVDPARPGLAMLSAARAVELARAFAASVVPPDEAAHHWVVFCALDRPADDETLARLCAGHGAGTNMSAGHGAGANMSAGHGAGADTSARSGAGTDTSAGHRAGADTSAGLLVDAAGLDETALASGLAAAMQAGAAPLPCVAVRLDALDDAPASEDPVGAPLGAHLAAGWIAAGRPVRLVPATAAQDGETPSLAGRDGLEGAALALRGAAGHVPLALLQRLGRLTGDTGLKALRARHARLNGDVLAAIAAGPAASADVHAAGPAADFRAAGLALTRPVRKADSPAPWAEEVFATELGRYGVERAWVGAQIARSRRIFKTLAETRTRETCLIVGNGASLGDADPALFANHDVIISNFAFNSPLLARHAKILTVTNALVAEQGAAGFNTSPVPVKVAPMWLARTLHEDAGFAFVNATGETAFFATDPAEKISWSSTVSFFNLQLAFALGYRRALLVGFDHSYVQPAESRLGDVLDQDEDDPNHFDPLYFKKRRWQAADTAAMEEVYRLARAAFEADARDVLNLSPASKLDVFDRHDPAEPLPPLRSASHARTLTPAAGFAAADEEDEAALEAREALAATGFACLSAKISENLDTGDYKHIVCALESVTAKRRAWNYIYFKLQNFKGETYLELRQGDFVPSGFTPWPIPDADTWGAFLRVPLDTPERAAKSLDHFAGGLGTEDREAFARLVEAIPDLVRAALDAEDGADTAIWAPGLAALEASRHVEVEAE
ncbi:hypothetical protein ATO13_23436 [Stappia sp. 22II-S9-Z10]|nr:hypothetical protein ATO13_23436 [Stappia sp. 22II-S9-Z10]